MFLSRASSLDNQDEENFAEEGEVSKDTIARILSGRMETEQDAFDEYWQPDALNGFLSYEKMKYIVNRR